MNACHEALRLLRDGQVDAAQSLLAMVCERPSLADGYVSAVETCDELEVDDNPCFSPGDGGCWVSAWVWVEDAESEGWALFDAGGVWQIQRDDEAAIFPDDEAAIRFVRERASEGSERHTQALAKHGREVTS